jgi:ATP-dependent HslUV protease subunit HslV
LTTLCVVVKNGEVALATDGLSVAGNTRFPGRETKLIRFTDTLFVVSGYVAHHRALLSALTLLSERQTVDLSTEESIFQVLTDLHPILKERFFTETDEDEDHQPYESSQLWYMLANSHGAFTVSSFRHVKQISSYWAQGSGSDYALGSMFTQYESAKTAAQVARVGVEAGCAFDIYSGPPITVEAIGLA